MRVSGLSAFPTDAKLAGILSVGNIPQPKRAQSRGPIFGADVLATSALRLGAAYRFQITPEFTLAEATRQIPYLARLGVTSVYASPLLASWPGSPHGYNVVDPGRLDPARTTEAQFETFSKILRSHGMGLILDIVPNHMGVGKHNPWWMSVLEHGKRSPYARFFDIDWTGGGEKVVLPVLGDLPEKLLAKGELTLAFSGETGKLSLRYYDHEFPVAPETYAQVLGQDLETLASQMKGAGCIGDFKAFESMLRQVTSPTTSAEKKEQQFGRLLKLRRENVWIREFIESAVGKFSELPKLLERQHYELAFWKTGRDRINYRRFFDVSELAGLRVEQPGVFERAHRLVLKLLGEGKISALRIDHVDGLARPQEYLQRLQRAAKNALGLSASAPMPPVLVEKILADHETLPETWPVSGTTGYEFLNKLSGLFVETRSEQALTDIYDRFLEDPDADIREGTPEIKERSNSPEYIERMIHQCKERVLSEAFTSDLTVLTTMLVDLDREDRFTQAQYRQALEELIVHFPVYRAYFANNRGDKISREHLEMAVSWIEEKGHEPTPGILEKIAGIFTQTAGLPDPALARRFITRFQQLTSAAMAKGVEDTFLYRYNRLTSLNEVGSEPALFATPVFAFHNHNRYQLAHHPGTMNTTSTHDTKRAADVRARIHAISEMPGEWESAVTAWRDINEAATPCRILPNHEYLFYQALVGTWPLNPMTQKDKANYSDRLANYMLKVVREAKDRTSWITPDTGYEKSLETFVRTALSNQHFLETLNGFLKKAVRPGLVNALGQVVLKIASPGIPDIYQGDELWNFSLVDPDNRRPVDYSMRKWALDSVERVMSQSPQQRRSILKDWVSHPEEYRTKALVTHAALQCRKDMPEVFEKGEYIPLEAKGPASKHVVAFARKYQHDVVIVAVPRLSAGLLKKGYHQGLALSKEALKNTSLDLTELTERFNGGMGLPPLENVFTGESVPMYGKALSLRTTFAPLPVGIFKIKTGR